MAVVHHVSFEEMESFNLRTFGKPSEHPSITLAQIEEDVFAYLMSDGKGKSVGLYFFHLRKDKRFESVLDMKRRDIIGVHPIEKNFTHLLILAKLAEQSGLVIVERDGKDMDGVQDHIYVFKKPQTK